MSSGATKILLAALALVGLVGQLSAASLPSVALRELARLLPSAHDADANTCQLYESYLASQHSWLSSGESHLASLVHALTSAREPSEPVESMGEPEQRTLSIVKACLASQHQRQHQGEHGARAASGRVDFHKVGLAKLSKVRQDVKTLALDRRCEAYDEALREILAGQEAAHASRPALFRAAIESLAAREVPFGNSAPFVDTLRECVEKLSAYQDAEGGATLAPGPARQVIAGPRYEPEPLTGAPANPLEGIRNEFNNVKERVVDHGQDLYAPKGEQLAAERRAAEQRREEAEEEELQFHGYAPDDFGDDYNNDHGYEPTEAAAADNGGLMQPRELLPEERYRPRRPILAPEQVPVPAPMPMPVPVPDPVPVPEHAPVHPGEPEAHFMPLVNEYLLEETYDELIRREREPVRKLELQLEAERRIVARLLKQLDDGQYEAAELREQVAGLRRLVDGLPDARLDELRRLYERALERERLVKERYEHLARKHEDLEAQLVLERNFDNYDDDDDDDEHDEDDGEEYGRERGRRRENWTEKERKEREKEEKKWRKEAEKAANKLNKDKSKEKERSKEKGKKEEEKVYKDPVDLARKLVGRLRASESPEQRCQKYFVLLNHPGKVTKKVLKTVAKLSLPRASAIQDPEFYNSLSYYAGLIARNSDNRDAREAAQEMAACARLAQGRHAAPGWLESDHHAQPAGGPYGAHTNRQAHGGQHGGQHGRAPAFGRTSRPAKPVYSVPVEFVDGAREQTPGNNKNPAANFAVAFAQGGRGGAAAAVAGGGGSGATHFAHQPANSLEAFQAANY